jgi:septal ring factor EnvC (AmiA/AmiB activator)
MFYDFSNMTWGQIFKKVTFDIFIFLISFGVIRWLVTDNLWLCFFLSGAAVTAQTANAKADKLFEVLKAVSRDFNNNDEHKRIFDERIENLESSIEELEKRNSELKDKIDEISNPNKFHNY